MHEPRCFEGLPERGSRFSNDPRQIYYPKAKLQQDHPESVCRALMVRTMTHKLIYRAEGLSELYDLRSDPKELSNLYGRSDAVEVQRTLERRLLDWYVETSDVTPFDEDPRGLPS